jgi:hypothetical protein
VAGTRTIYVDHRDRESVETAKNAIVNHIGGLDKDCADIESPIPLDLKLSRQNRGRILKLAIAGFLLGVLTLAVIAHFLPLPLRDNQTVFRFENANEAYNYVAERLSHAKRVDDITWGLRTEFADAGEVEAYKRYDDSLKHICSKGTAAYREISSLATAKYFKRSIDLVQQGCYNYRLGYYDATSTSIPLISYIVIDNEVVLGFYRAGVPSSEKDEVFLRVRNSDIVDLFEDYFQTLWNGSRKLKDINHADWEVIHTIGKHSKVEPAYLERLPLPESQKK